MRFPERCILAEGVGPLTVTVTRRCVTQQQREGLFAPGPEEPGLPYDGDVELVPGQALPRAVEELSAPQVRHALGLRVRLLEADQVLAVLLDDGLDLQRVLGHQDAQSDGGGRGGDPGDEFGFHVASLKKKK